MFLVMPLALMLAGVVVIDGVGITAALYFALFVAVPIAIFNQIFTFERAMAIYRYQSAAFASYIYCFVVWGAAECQGELDLLWKRRASR